MVTIFFVTIFFRPCIKFHRFNAKEKNCYWRIVEIYVTLRLNTKETIDEINREKGDEIVKKSAAYKRYSSAQK